ncbi:MAG: hypothetical protein ACXAC5_16355 [Promethearchaeota archaeon]
MKKKNIIILIIAGFVVSGGVAFGVVVFATWGEFAYSNNYSYDPGIPSSWEKVSFASDVGAINIKYNTTPTNYVVEIDLDIKISGGFVAGKTFSDFFKPITWLNDSVPVVTFHLENNPTTWFIFPIIRRITINVTLRTDVNYDVAASSNTGAINMDIPVNSDLNNTILSTSTGSVSLNANENVTFSGNFHVSANTGSIALYAQNVNFSQGITTLSNTGSQTLNFTNCIMGDDIRGAVSTGSITLRSYNMLYSQNCVWDFDTSTGSINAVIYQYIDMGANITGSMTTSTGSIDINYIDNQASVGASFFGTWSTGSYTRASSGGGFSATNLNPYYSLDYGTATSTYTLSLTTSTGGIDVDGTSS